MLSRFCRDCPGVMVTDCVPCWIEQGGGHANATIKVLTGETIDIRVLVDRPIVEIFVNNGRAGHVAVSE